MTRRLLIATDWLVFLVALPFIAGLIVSSLMLEMLGRFSAAIERRSMR